MAAMVFPQWPFFCFLVSVLKEEQIFKSIVVQKWYLAIDKLSSLQVQSYEVFIICKLIGSLCKSGPRNRGQKTDLLETVLVKLSSYTTR